MSSRYEPVKPPTEQVAHSNSQAKIDQSQHTITPCRGDLPALVYITTSTEARCAMVFSNVANRDFVPTIPKSAMSVPGRCNCEPPVGVPIRGQLRLPYSQPCLKRTASCLLRPMPMARRAAPQTWLSDCQSCCHSNQTSALCPCLHWKRISDSALNRWRGLRSHVCVPIVV